MTHGRFLLLYAVAVPAALVAAHFAFGGPAVLAVAVASILALAVHFDNRPGSWLLLTIILLIVLGVLLSLLMLVAHLIGH